MGGTRSAPQCSIACANCRLKKAKCKTSTDFPSGREIDHMPGSGSSPCTSCTSHNWECVFLGTEQQRQRQRKRKAVDVEERLARLEGLLHEGAPASNSIGGPEYIAGNASMIPRSVNSVSSQSHYSPGLLNEAATSKTSLQDIRISSPARSMTESSISLLNENPGRHLCQQSSSKQSQAGHAVILSEMPVYPPLWDDAPQTTTVTEDIPTNPILDEISEESLAHAASSHRGLPVPKEVSAQFVFTFQSLCLMSSRATRSIMVSDISVPSRRSAILTRRAGNDSYLSICSMAGVDWISQQTGSSEFVFSAQKLTSTINRSLKLSRPPSQARATEPDRETARSWIKGNVTLRNKHCRKR